MKLAIGNDHSAVEMKKEIKKYLEDKGIEVIDVGTNSTESFNYPISGYKVGKMVASPAWASAWPPTRSRACVPACAASPILPA